EAVQPAEGPGRLAGRLPEGRDPRRSALLALIAPHRQAAPRPASHITTPGCTRAENSIHAAASDLTTPYDRPWSCVRSTAWSPSVSATRWLKHSRSRISYERRIGPPLTGPVTATGASMIAW